MYPACLHVRSLDEIRAPRPWQQFGLLIGPTESTRSWDAGLTGFVITIRKLRKPVMVYVTMSEMNLSSVQCLHESVCTTGSYVASVLRST